MMLNGVIAALVAITAASGFVAPWAGIVIGLIAGGRAGAERNARRGAVDLGDRPHVRNELSVAYSGASSGARSSRSSSYSASAA